MAEAHSAVAFSFSITHEGWDVNFDREVLNIVWSSGVRSWKKRLARFKNNVKNGVYPASIQSYWITVAVLAGFNLAGYRVPGGLLERLQPHLPENSLQWQFLACCGVGFLWWILCIYTIRYTFKLLLMYKGWMYEERGKGSSISLATKLWLVAVKLLTVYGKPMLYSYQGSLPRLPVPPLQQTLDRYLRSVRPLLDDEKFLRMKNLVDEFKKGLGKKCQRYLLLKSWWATNYVSDWWEEFVYLRGRAPLLINSNFYGVDAILRPDVPLQAARAGSMIYCLLQFRRLIERQELEPILVQGLVPLCSSQYERVFNTTRVPGIETDKIIHYADSNHIVVYHKGRYFKVIIYHNKRLLNPSEIEIQMRQILENTSEPLPGETQLAALTGGSRVHWAQTRQALFFKGVNRACLDIVEKAAFVVCLDDVPYEFDRRHPEQLDQFGRNVMHGKGYDRWYDKSFTLCIGSNGRVGFNAEHSWADAAVMSHMWEWVFVEEFSHPKMRADAPVMGHAWEFSLGWENEPPRYTDDGHCVGVAEFVPPAPIRINWNLTEPYQRAIELSYNEVSGLIKDIDLRILCFDQYGKGFMKQCRISPDAYVQMALQLAYYRDAGKFSLTYEASMTRLYREGRTETVRPCTIESSAWVKSMESSCSTLEQRVALLLRAAKMHQKGYQDAMCGKGIDRHLFCLYVVSKYLEVESPFLNEVLSEPWRLSTSQTPHGQTPKFDLKKYPNCISAGGGFGPVADDGYGVSYIIAGEDLLFFHISSKHSCLETSSAKFASQIVKALDDMRQLFTDFRNQQKTSNGEITSK